MGVNSLRKTVIRQSRGSDLNPRALLRLSPARKITLFRKIKLTYVGFRAHVKIASLSRYSNNWVVAECYDPVIRVHIMLVSAFQSLGIRGFCFFRWGFLVFFSNLGTQYNRVPINDEPAHRIPPIR